ncbi:hypothetical protein BJ138DRAFT_1118847 [Hygrophoropsis aurantiaca]|uniref:Uncharacterized protein n=1 Tax=Hygrophoropsis aurantiaca TaxID=72124 RepID=A0ACB7ZUZ2_9AGAM|nr:hypothetical protein BJ138DRAFT_1118847 [Hygrophoropsis aurantiaca]
MSNRKSTRAQNIPAHQPGTRSSLRRGKASKVDDIVSGTPTKVTENAPEEETLPVRKARAALLKNPPWAIKQNRKQAVSAAKKEVNARNSTQELEQPTSKDKRKRAESAADAGATRINVQRESKKTKVTSQKTGYRYRAAQIDVNTPDSDHQASPVVKSTKLQVESKPQSRGAAGTSSGTAQASDENEDGLDEEGDSEDITGNAMNSGSEDEEGVDDRDAEVTGFQYQEVAWFDDAGIQVADKKIMNSHPLKIQRHLRASSLSTDGGIVPPSTDFDSDSEEGGELSIRPPEKKSHRQQKLEDEMPKIKDSDNARSKGKQCKPAVVKDEDELEYDAHLPFNTEDDDEECWLSRTHLNLMKKGRNNVEIAIKAQGPEIREVIRGSYDLGMRSIAFGHKGASNISPDEVMDMTTPLVTGGLERIALAALVESAEHAGFDGEFDIADRLEQGSPKLYIKPIRDYTVHRLGLHRTAVKKAVALVAPGVLNLARNSKTLNLGLMDGNNYIHPWSEEKGFAKTKPFKGEVIEAGLRAAFFTQSQYNGVALKFCDGFTSSDPNEPLELEVPAPMIALTATAVCFVFSLISPQLIQVFWISYHLDSSWQTEAVILDFINKTTNDFAGSAFDNTFKAHMLLLTQLRTNKPSYYHKLTHGLYKALVAGHHISSQKMTKEQILAQVPWDELEDSD